MQTWYSSGILKTDVKYLERINLPMNGKHRRRRPLSHTFEKVHPGFEPATFPLVDRGGSVVLLIIVLEIGSSSASSLSLLMSLLHLRMSPLPHRIHPG